MLYMTVMETEWKMMVKVLASGGSGRILVLPTPSPPGQQNLFPFCCYLATRTDYPLMRMISQVHLSRDPKWRPV